MERLNVGSPYQLRFYAFPMLGIPLIPKYLYVRTHEGVVYTISNFTGPDKGWYYATLFPQNEPETVIVKTYQEERFAAC